MKTFITRDKLYALAAILLILIIWDRLSYAVGAEVLLPTPAQTFRELIKIINSGTFWQAILSTTVRSMVGFFLTLFVAALFAVLAGVLKPLYYLFEQLVLIAKAAPPISIVLLALIWLGSEISPVLVGFLVIFPIIYTNIVTGIGDVDRRLLQMAQVYKISGFRKVTGIYLPSIMPYVLAACSTALGLNLRVVIMAEVLSQPQISIGTSLHSERIFLNTAGVFAWTLTAIAIAAIFDVGMDLLKRKTIQWK